MAMIPVCHRAKGIFRPTWIEVNEGRTIEQIILSVPDLPAIFLTEGTVTIDRKDGRGSEPVPRHMWSRVKPKGDFVEVNLWLAPESGKGLLSLILTVAVIVAAAVVSGPLGVGFLGTTLGLSATAAATAAKIAGAGIAILGSLAIRALSPPPSAAALSAPDTDTSVTPASLGGNVLAPGSIIPHVRGARKIFPPIVVKPLVELDSAADEWLTAVFALAGPHALNDIRIDGEPIDNMTGDELLDYETREGFGSDTDLTLVDRQSLTDAALISLTGYKTNSSASGGAGSEGESARLSDQSNPQNCVSKFHGMRIQGGPDEVWVALTWPQGFYDSSSPTTPVVMNVRMRIRAVGQTQWTILPEIGFIYDKAGNPFTKEIKLMFMSMPSPDIAPQPLTSKCPYVAFTFMPMRLHSDIGDMTNFALANNGLTTSGSSATRAGVTSAYIGSNFAQGSPAVVHARKFYGLSVSPGDSSGRYNSSAGSTMTFNARGRTAAQGAPANGADGTLLATLTFADVAEHKHLESNDYTTDWQYLWLEITTTISGTIAVRELMLFDDGTYSGRAHSSFWKSPGLNSRHIDSTNYTTTEVRGVHLYAHAAEIYLNPTDFPKGDYEFEIRRSSHDTAALFVEDQYADISGRVQDMFNWEINSGVFEVPRTLSNIQQSVQRKRFAQVWNEHPLPDVAGKLALIAIRLKNQQVNALSVVASRYVNDWNGSAWATQSTTANPATHVYDILTGGLNADPAPTELIDNDSLVDWRTRCAAEGYEVNAVLEGATVDVAALMCSGAGYARLRQSEVFSIIQDKDRSAESPVQIFTSRNSRGLTYEKNFLRRPSGLRVIYGDSTNDYKETELLVDDPDGDGEGRYEEARYDALVTQADAQARALFDLAQARLRNATYIFESNAQAIKCQRGDLIGLNHPVLLSHMGAAYIQQVLTSGSNITGLILDGEVPLDGSVGTLGAVIRLHDQNGEQTGQIEPFDPGFSLLMHADGTDGSTTFTDVAGHTLTANGNAQVDTAQSKFGGASALFDGSGDFIVTALGTDGAFGTGDFTVECWVRFNDTSAQRNFVDFRGSSAPGNCGVLYMKGALTFAWWADSDVVESTTTAATGQWYHIAVTRSGTTTRLFVNGTLEDSDTDTRTYTNGTGGPHIGGQNGSETMNGWIDEVRVIKGTAVWTESFTPETSAYPDPDATSREITFTTPISGPITGLDRDCLVIVGVLGEEYHRLIVTEIMQKSGPSFPCDIVAVDEAPELWPPSP